MDRESAVIDIKELYFKKYMRLVKEKGYLKTFIQMHPAELDLVVQYIQERNLKPLTFRG